MDSEGLLTFERPTDNTDWKNDLQFSRVLQKQQLGEVECGVRCKVIAILQHPHSLMVS